MSAAVRILLVIAIIVYVIGRQVLGEALRGKRVVVLPVVLTVIGVVDVSHGGAHAGARDVVLLTVNALIAARLVSTGIADAVHAHLAASSTSVLLILGPNRLAQAAVVLPRAITAGVPFAPEKDCVSFLDGLSRPVPPQSPSRVPALDADDSRATPDRSDFSAIDWAQVGRRAQQFLDQRPSAPSWRRKLR